MSRASADVKPITANPAYTLNSLTLMHLAVSAGEWDVSKGVAWPWNFRRSRVFMSNPQNMP